MSTFDWRTLAPPQDTHDCDCEFCDRGGELHPVEWPVLVPMLIGGVEYVTDRFMVLRADLAPIPDGYVGPVLDLGERAPSGFLLAPPTDIPATDLTFRPEYVAAVETVGARLVLLDHGLDASSMTKRAAGIVTASGELVGWAMARAGGGS